MANTYLFTGFPGFLASSLLKEMHHQSFPIERVYLLHLPIMKQQAHRQLQQLKESGINAGDIQLLEGDITKPDLGLDSNTSQSLKQEITHFFHLAALYDLAVPLSSAWKVNVKGTRMVNQWLHSCLSLQRYIYFSTAFVSGQREGIIYEEELTHEQGFKNHYEYTKYIAEQLVTQAQRELPTTIIRPGITVGHSRSGETLKFDGPYFILNMLGKLNKLPFVPHIGNSRAKINLVPYNYVVEATLHLAHFAEGLNKTYHLTDPNPYPAQDIYEMFSNELNNKEPHLTLPVPIASTALQLKWIRKWMGVQREAVSYFLCESEYDCTHTLYDLRKTDIRCPDFASYASHLVDYYKQHRDKKEKHVSIV
ncbi:SDR family oxidoreductase [Halobacillus salinarum]|uniref:SDR family oxidoreductase n=1 Tax=Halobacillus salinarum TaxID=2932257 RepID=A0ABY4EIP8_9BACI|nr:SDR family oxidoreductase [Halobacillus salinarum]UOQ44361.1 SDR family oxidoreductase [Halobacillus salinarum]